MCLQGAFGLSWLDLGPDVVAFRRDPGFVCVVNTGTTPVPLPDGEMLLSSLPIDGGVPSDVAVWLATD